MSEKTCVACGCGQLELGFIPDVGDSYVNFVLGWYAGNPKDNTFLGMKTGGVSSDSERQPVTAYRCTDCGFLHLYVE